MFVMDRCHVVTEVGVEFLNIYCLDGETGSSVSIVSGYGLDDPAIKVRSPTEAKEFFL
jgi:hypothetical protein